MIAQLVLASALHVSVKARSVQPGELVVVTIASRAQPHTVRVRAFERDVKPFAVDDHRWRALVGIDLDVRPGTYPVLVETDDGERGSCDLIVAPRRFRTRHLNVDPAFVTPPPSARERIRREARLLDVTWNSSAPERLWKAAFVLPVSEPATSAFGTRSVFNGMERNAHGGADFMSPAGTPIHAPNAGRVLVARNLYFSGNTIVIDHGLGLFSTLAHLSAFAAHEGDQVAAGQIVGRVGATGRVTGPHLHWAIRIGGARVDPLSVIALLGERRP